MYTCCNELSRCSGYIQLDHMDCIVLGLHSSHCSCSWWVFRSWGRVGTTVGGNKVEKFGSQKRAVEHFKALYADKTNNEWENRNNFKKFPNKFYPLDIDYGQVI